MKMRVTSRVADKKLLVNNNLKKKPALQQAMKEQFFERGKENHASDNLLNYVWKEVVGKQLGLNEGSSKTQETQAKVVSVVYRLTVDNQYWSIPCRA